tara:strand:+ start:100 stop:315 length:216 start_codon:yes stop_codon:yes gene_type:complete
MPVLFRTGSKDFLFIGTPSKIASPELGWINPLTTFKSVDLPAPEGPKRTQNCPFGIDRDTSSTARVPSGNT